MSVAEWPAMVTCRERKTHNPLANTPDEDCVLIISDYHCPRRELWLAHHSENLHSLASLPLRLNLTSMNYR
jgi:hypothetical protein